MMSYQFLKFKLCYALFFVYNIKDIFRLLYPGNVSSCLKAMPSVVIIWNLLLKTQPAAAHSYYFQSVILAWFVSHTYTRQTQSSDQQKLTTPLLSNNECIELFKNISGGVVFDVSIEAHLCAGGVQGEDSCNGDSGGPLLGRELPDDPYTLIGLVSGGTRRCGLAAPAIYTRVSHYRNWILSHMN